MSRHLMLSLALALVTASSAGAQATTPAPAQPARPTAERADSNRITFEREVYRYPRDGRRDPFASLIATGDIRPIFADLIVSGIIFDAGGRSVAMLEDVSTGELYRARVGSVFGRIRVTAIRQRSVGVAIDEFGFTRQETLSLTVPNPAERTP